MPVELAYQYFGKEGLPPLVILHGLWGSSRNWRAAAMQFALEREVFALDLRNHGDSPWSPEMSFDLMAEDVLSWLDRQRLPSVELFGHSMGGKVAMRCACERPERVAALIVADIAPKQYAPRYERAFEGMARLDLSEIKTRDEAETRMLAYEPDSAARKFFLSNLRRIPDGGFRWSANLQVIRKSLPIIFDDSLEPGMRYDGPTLFMRGSRSDFVEDEDALKIEEHFPEYALATIPNAGHNIHAENLDGMLKVFSRYAQMQAS